MKKILLVIAVILSATLTNAQITKVWSGPIVGFGSGVQVLDIDDASLIGNYIWTHRESGDTYYYDIMDASSLSIAKTFTWIDGSQDNSWFNIDGVERGPYFMSKGIFSADGKWACAVLIATETGVVTGGADAGATYNIYTEMQIRNEDGTVLATIPIYYISYMYNTEFPLPQLIKTNDSYKLVAPVLNNEHEHTYEYDIYYLPGNDMTQNLVATPLPQNIFTRKIIQNGQVLVKTEKNTYNLQGQKVRH